MDSSDEPAAKRRKLFTGDAPGYDVSKYYIAIAKASLDLEPLLQTGVEGLQTVSLQDPVNIKSVIRGGSTPLVVKLTGSNKRPLPDLRGSSSSPFKNAVQILEDASKFDSLWKYANIPHKLPLTCARASLSCIKLEESSKTIYRLEVEILWYNTGAAQDKISEPAAELLRRYQREDTKTNSKAAFETWSPRDFYENVHVPKKNSQTSAEVKVDLLQCQLYPFQRRAVRWLLEKEGVQIHPSGQITSLRETHASATLPDSFQKSVDAYGRECYVSHVYGVVSDNLTAIQERYCQPRGGILAEEMGLGKTVEMIALMCLHRRDQLSQSNTPEDISLRRSGATLIITPLPILEQWKQEIREHAPSLKVYQYDGLKAKASRNEKSNLVDVLASQDVVLTTYNVISREIH